MSSSVTRMFLVTVDGAKNDQALWPLAAARRLLPDSLYETLKGRPVDFRGSSRKKIIATIGSADGSGNGAILQLQKGPDGWEDFRDSDEPGWSRPLPLPPAEAQAHAPWKLGPATGVAPNTADGNGAPLMSADPNKLAIWDGSRWKVTDAPWQGVQEVVRLASGDTLVLGDDVFVVDAKGHTRALHLLPTDEGTISSKILEIDGQVLVMSQTAAALYLHGPSSPGSTRLLDLDQATVKTAPTASAVPPAAPASAPSGSVTASTGSAAPIASGPSSAAPFVMPPPAGFHASCPAPFVTLVVRPADAGALDYPLVREAVTGHTELQDRLTLVEFRSGDRLYFGAQATDETTARALMALVGAKKMKPQLGCLDVRGTLQGRDPRAVVRFLAINFHTGEIL